VYDYFGRLHGLLAVTRMAIPAGALSDMGRDNAGVLWQFETLCADVGIFFLRRRGFSLSGAMPEFVSYAHMKEVYEAPQSMAG